MDSIFSRETPVHEKSKTKPFYSPSTSLGKAKKSDQESFMLKGNQELAPEEPIYSVSGIVLKDQTPTLDEVKFEDSSGSSKYDETWPSSEQAFVEVADITSGVRHVQRVSPSGVTPKQSNIKNSTLAKYIERFRKEPPKKKDERMAKSSSERSVFWWLSPPSTTSTPTAKEDTKSATTSTPCKVTSGAAVSSRKNKNISQRVKSPKASDTEWQAVDLQTKRLQDRAEKLIEFSESTMSSSTIQWNEHSPSQGWERRNSDERRDKDLCATKELTAVQEERTRKALKPEDDILYQWRLARKIAQARETALPHPSSYKTGAAYSLDGTADQSQFPGKQDLRKENVQKGISRHNGLVFSKAPDNVRFDTLEVTRDLMNSCTQTDYCEEDMTVPPKAEKQLHAESRAAVALESTAPGVLRVSVVNPSKEAIPVFILNSEDQNVSKSRQINDRESLAIAERPHQQSRANRGLDLVDFGNDFERQSQPCKSGVEQGGMLAAPRAKERRRKGKPKALSCDVRQTIGKTVTEHLFSTRTDSESGTSTKDSLKESDSFEDPVHAVSSEEEFPDDELLQTLRHRRREYITRLRRINDFLGG